MKVEHGSSIGRCGYPNVYLNRLSCPENPRSLKRPHQNENKGLSFFTNMTVFFGRPVPFSAGSAQSTLQSKFPYIMCSVRHVLMFWLSLIISLVVVENCQAQHR
jgi:hypothetical protein